jgi:hypothetical protein
MFNDWLQPFYWLYTERIQLILILYAIPHSQKVLLQKKFHECWMMGYCVWYPTYPLHPTHTGPSTANTCMWPECVSFSRIMMDNFKYTSVMFSPIRISILIFSQCSDKTSIPRTTHKTSICTLCISKSRPFCCDCSCYWSYCVSQISVLHSLLLWSLSAEHPIKWSQQHKATSPRTCITQKQRWICKSLFTLSPITNVITTS